LALRKGNAVPRRPGLTLIEILVVLGIISALMGVVIPSVSAVRRSARSVQCLATQADLHNAAMARALSDNEWLPGLNRTGLPLLESVSAAAGVEGDTTPDTPTSTFDWISPSIGSSVNLSPNRARRTWQIFEDLACPEARRFNDQTFGFSNDLRGDFLPILQREGFRQISYLAPATFQYAGPRWPRTRYVRFPFRGPVVPPARYLPRLEKVGVQMATKVFVADGTRYLTAGGVLDFDVDPAPDYYGSFTSSTPIYSGSTAYGLGPGVRGMDVVGPGREAHAERRRLSYRHSGSINAVYFDGHGGSITEEDSRADATPWAPGGSVFTGVAATPESADHHAEGEVIH